MKFYNNVIFELLKEIKKKILEVEIILDSCPFVAYDTGGAGKWITPKEGMKMRSNEDNEHILLKELILYIANKLVLHPKFGATKLNKILFYSDFIAYAKLEKSITGEKYQKLVRGPAPKYLMPVKKEMDGKDITCYTRQTLSGIQHRIAPKRPADLKKFTPEQISIVDEVIDLLKDKDALEVSELSHNFIGWQIVKEGQEIPYETVFLRDPKDIKVTERHNRIAQKLAEINEPSK